MANKYRYLDENDDLISWAYIGFLNAYEEYKVKKEIKLPALIFRHIKKIYIEEYFKKNRVDNSELILDKPMPGKDGIEGDTLISTIESDSFYYSEKDIEEMVLESLFELEYREALMEYYLYDDDVANICKTYKLTKVEMRRLIRRGHALIVQYLENNLYITEWAMNPERYTFAKQDPIKTLTSEQCRQLKYIRETHPLLSRSDYAGILECDIRSINYTLDYPTTTYIRYGLDDSIKDKAEAYIREHYPHMLPSEVEELVMV